MCLVEMIKKLFCLVEEKSKKIENIIGINLLLYPYQINFFAHYNFIKKLYIDGHFIKKYKQLKNPKANVKKITNVKGKKKKMNTNKNKYEQRRRSNRGRRNTK